MRRAYHADSALAAEAELCALAAELDRTHPGAATSLREGMTETLTVLRLAIPPTLARTFRSTNAVESMISICDTGSGSRPARRCRLGGCRPLPSARRGPRRPETMWIGGGHAPAAVFERIG